MQETTPPFHYVYILQSIPHPIHFYTGFTENLQTRLKSHNHGQVPHTAPHKPWRIKTAIAFTDHQKARDFETYLKNRLRPSLCPKTFIVALCPIAVRPSRTLAGM